MPSHDEMILQADALAMQRRGLFLCRIVVQPLGPPDMAPRSVFVWAKNVRDALDEVADATPLQGSILDVELFVLPGQEPLGEEGKAPAYHTTQSVRI